MTGLDFLFRERPYIQNLPLNGILRRWHYYSARRVYPTPAASNLAIEILNNCIVSISLSISRDIKIGREGNDLRAGNTGALRRWKPTRRGPKAPALRVRRDLLHGYMAVTYPYIASKSPILKFWPSSAEIM
jgi:hypothetical protein